MEAARSVIVYDASEQKETKYSFYTSWRMDIRNWRKTWKNQDEDGAQIEQWISCSIQVLYSNRYPHHYGFFSKFINELFDCSSESLTAQDVLQLNNT